jgi:hypothetical protein
MAELADMGEPGFYQGVRGRKTGRAAPRQAIRPPRREVVYARHGLIDQGAADPNQGQLFDTSNVTVSMDQRAAQLGLTPGVTTVRPTPKAGKPTPKGLDLPLAAAPGFMPGLTAKQKVDAIKSAGELIETRTINPETGKEEVETGSPTPVKLVMERRQESHDEGVNQPWYSGVSPETGEHDLSIPGDSPRLIAESAERMGVSPQAMTRSVAITSPRNRWLEGTAAESNVMSPNIQSAEGAIGVAKSLPASATDDQIKAASTAVSGRGLPAMVEKAARQYRSTNENVTTPIPIASRLSQKVPNFEHSLKLSGAHPAARRIAAESYTVDTHDLGSVGMPENALNRVGMYELMAMTGARTAFKNYQLPPNEQAREWVVQKSRVESPALGGLFVEDRKGRLLSNPQFRTQDED